MFNYKIFIIFHEKINIKFFHPSILKHLIFINVNPNNTNKYSNLNIIQLENIPDFVSLGKWYTESEVIYNIYKNKLIMDDCDYVGFVHYDIDMMPLTDAFLQKQFDNKISAINLQSYPFKDDYDQKILMDDQNPNTLRGEGKNCYLSIFADYNTYYQSSHKIHQYINHRNINLCSSFIMYKADFISMMGFISQIIESKKLDIFDTEHKYRIQGGFLERYYAVWILLQEKNNINMKLKHEFIETNKQMPFFIRLKNVLKNKTKAVFKSIHLN